MRSYREMYFNSIIEITELKARTGYRWQKADIHE
jgi:hypothetical protein